MIAIHPDQQRATLPGKFRRLVFDITYARTQSRPTGITRTVLRLMQELSAECALVGLEFVPVAYHSTGFRRVDAAVTGRPGTALAERPADAFAIATGSRSRRLVGAVSRLPWPIWRWAWTAASAFVFDQRSRGEQPLAFGTGDLLVLCDASWNYPVWGATRQARRQGATAMLLVYDLMPINAPQYCFPLVPPTFRLWLRHMLQCSDAVLCISRATQDELTDFARMHVLALPPVDHFRLGADPAPTDAPQGAGRLGPFMGEAVPCFLCVGSIEPKKHLGLVLDVFEALWARGEAVRLVIAGRPTPECAGLVNRMQGHPEQGRRLLTLGDATDAEIAHAYSACRALVFPSMTEGFGLPLVEARARGCAVIASDIPAFRELADEAVTLFPRGSATALEAALLACLRRPQRSAGPRITPVSWRDSARQLLDKGFALLAPGVHAS